MDRWRWVRRHEGQGSPRACALCPGEPGSVHVYIDSATQARRIAAAKAANARIRAAVEKVSKS